MKLVPLSKKNAAFSLVEVTLAIGITAVALVSLMGMLPKGMQTMQRAADKAVMGRIHQQILGEIQLTPWESAGGGNLVDAFDGQVRFYDDQGIELPASEKGEFSHVYTARITVPRSGSSLPASVGSGSHGGVKVPGEVSIAGRDPQDWGRLIIVEVTSIADPQFLSNPRSGFDNVQNRKAIFTYRTIVAKMGRDFDT